MTTDLRDDKPTVRASDPTAATSGVAVTRPETFSRQNHDVAAYWAERRKYLDKVRKVPELRQRYWRALAIYMLRRALWSFGFFPVFIAFWVPLVMSSFNPVIMIRNLMPALQNFLEANPEIQANTMGTLIIAWFSVGFFFLVFDFVLTPFKSPYQYEADVHMRAWEQLNHEQLPDKV